MGSIVPSSLFASMMVISTVSGRIARRTSSGFTTPSRSTGRIVTATPRFSSALQGSKTALCSIAGGDDVLGAARGRCHNAENGMIVRFRAAAGERDLRRARPQHGRHRNARLFDRAAGILPKRVDRARVAVFLAEIRQHGSQNFREPPAWSRYSRGRLASSAAIPFTEGETLGYSEYRSGRERSRQQRHTGAIPCVSCRAS